MRRTALIMAGCLMSLTFATAAQANTTPLGSTQLHGSVASAKTCSTPLIERPFARFRDQRDYIMAPDGSFEDAVLEGWQLFGGAKRVIESDPVDLGANDGRGMLAMPKGGVAISPTMCVDLHYPTFRLLGKALRLPDSAAFKIEIVYPDTANPHWEDLTQFDGKQFVYAGSGWLLTSDLDMKPDLGGPMAGFRRAAFRFSALSGDWRMDDLYVDPRRRI
jgi:hypothetical protein